MRSRFAMKPLLATALAASCFTFSACKKSSTAADSMTYMPKDTSMIINVNFEQARGSELFKKYESQMMSKLPDEIAKIKSECNIDIQTVANRALIGLGADPQNQDDVVAVVSGSMEQSAVEACIAKLGGEGENKLIATTEGKITTYTGGEKPMVTYWPSKSTVVIGSSATRIKSIVDGTAGTINENESMKAQLANLDTSATLSMVGDGSMLAQTGQTPPKSMKMTLKATKDFALDVGLDFESEEEATKLAGMVTMAKGMAGTQGEAAKSLAEGLVSKQDGTALSISLSATAEQIEAIAAQAKSMGM